MTNLEGLDKNNWNEFCFDWAAFTQWEGAPAGALKTFDPTSLVQIEWKFLGSGNATSSTDGTLCIDDVRFQTAE